ncbi:MAG: DUF2177 family protein [Rhodospirillales bacterium]|nr:DUF2177 family protein [Rhodospirillales bacterium]
MGPWFYKPILGDSALDSFKLLPAALFYLIYAAGIVAFAVLPALETGRWQVALLRGLLFGLCAYATYDLTNHATLRNWSVSLTLVDIAWGALLTGIAATIGCFIAKLLLFRTV